MKICPSGMNRDIREVECAFAFVGLELPLRKQTAEPAIGRAISRINEQARRIFEVETHADHELDFRLFSIAGLAATCARTTPASELRSVTAIADSPSSMACLTRSSACEGPAQKRKIGRDLQLGITEYHWRPHAKSPCRNQVGPASLAASPS